MYRKTLTVILFLLFLLSFSSCRKADMEAVQSSGVLPDIIMEDATYVFGRPGNSPLLISAGKITVYSSTSEVFFENLSFSQEDGKISGSCEYGHSFNDEEIQLSGSVEVYNSEDRVRISATSVTWDDTDKTIVSDGTVTVVFEDENTVTGEGFSANINRNIYEFDKITEGRFDGE